MVVPAVGLHLQVLAQHVEAGVLHGLNVEGERLVGGSRHEAVGPVALIAEGGVAAHRIGAESHDDIVEARIVGAPAAHLAEIEPQAHATGRPRLP